MSKYGEKSYSDVLLGEDNGTIINDYVLTGSQPFINTPIFFFDKQHTTFTSIKQIVVNYLDVKITRVLNGEKTIEIDLADLKDMTNEDFIMYKNEKYIIRKITTYRNNQGKFFKLYAEGLYSMLIDHAVMTVDINGDPLDVELIGVDLRTALERTVLGSPFTIGTVDDFGLWDITFDDKNGLECINNMRSNWGINTMEFEFEGFIIHARSRIGTDTNNILNVSSNLESMERLADSSEVITRLIGKAVDGMGIIDLDVTSYSDSELVGFTWNVVDGKKIITKDYVDSPYINNYPFPKEGIKSWTELDSQDKLFTKMKNTISTIDQIKYTYTINYADLSKIGIQFSDINLGDGVRIVDTDLGLNVTGRVVEKTEVPERLEDSTLTISTRAENIIDYLTEIRSNKQTLDAQVAKTSKKYTLLETYVNAATNILNGNDSKVIFDNEKILCIQKNTLGGSGEILNTTKMLKIANGALGITVDGGASYRTAITANGINADVIVGNLIAGRIGEFENLIVQTDLGVPVVTIGNYTSPTYGGTRKGILVSSGALEIAGTLPDSNLSADILRTYSSYTGVTIDNTNGIMMTSPKSRVLMNTNWGFGIQRYENGWQNVLTLDADGNGYFAGVITAKDVIINGYSVLTAEKLITGAAINGKGIIVKNASNETTFGVDTNGNVIIKGNLTMTSGSITWGGGGVTAPNYTDIGGTKPPTNADNTFNYVTSKGLIYDAGRDKLTLNADYINAGTLTGFTIQTASSGQRSKIDIDGYTHYDQYGRKRVVIPNDISGGSIEFWLSSEHRFDIGESGGDFHIRQNTYGGNIYISDSNKTTYISGYLNLASYCQAMDVTGVTMTGTKRIHTGSSAPSDTTMVWVKT